MPEEEAKQSNQEPENDDKSQCREPENGEKPKSCPPVKKELSPEQVLQAQQEFEEVWSNSQLGLVEWLSTDASTPPPISIYKRNPRLQKIVDSVRRSSLKPEPEIPLAVPLPPESKMDPTPDLDEGPEMEPEPLTERKPESGVDLLAEAKTLPPPASKPKAEFKPVLVPPRPTLRPKSTPKPADGRGQQEPEAMVVEIVQDDLDEEDIISILTAENPGMAQENAIIAEEIASYNFWQITFKAKRATAIQTLLNTVLPDFTHKVGLEWDYDDETKIFTVSKIPNRDYKDKMMDTEQRAFLNKMILGFYSTDVKIEHAGPTLKDFPPSQQPPAMPELKEVQEPSPSVGPSVPAEPSVPSEISAPPVRRSPPPPPKHRRPPRSAQEPLEGPEAPLKAQMPPPPIILNLSFPSGYGAIVTEPFPGEYGSVNKPSKPRRKKLKKRKL